MLLDMKGARLTGSLCYVQAVARVHRVGQVKPVTVYQLLVAETVEVRTNSTECSPVPGCFGLFSTIVHQNASPRTVLRHQNFK